MQKMRGVSNNACNKIPFVIQNSVSTFPDRLGRHLKWISGRLTTHFIHHDEGRFVVPQVQHPRSGLRHDDAMDRWIGFTSMD